VRAHAAAPALADQLRALAPTCAGQLLVLITLACRWPGPRRRPRRGPVLVDQLRELAPTGAGRLPVLITLARRRRRPRRARPRRDLVLADQLRAGANGRRMAALITLTCLRHRPGALRYFALPNLDSHKPRQSLPTAGRFIPCEMSRAVVIIRVEGNDFCLGRLQLRPGLVPDALTETTAAK